MEVFKDLTVLCKKISSYRTPKGRITKLPDELLGEILHEWEQWSGSPAGFYSQLGVDYRKMGSMMGKAKKLKREGAFDGLSFTEVMIEEDAPQAFAQVGGCGIELVWDNKKIIRFGTPELLIDFLKRAA